MDTATPLARRSDTSILLTVYYEWIDMQERAGGTARRTHTGHVSRPRDRGHVLGHVTVSRDRIYVLTRLTRRG